MPLGNGPMKLFLFFLNMVVKVVKMADLVLEDAFSGFPGSLSLSSGQALEEVKRTQICIFEIFPDLRYAQKKHAPVKIESGGFLLHRI